jgi:hypothetical protein
MISLLTFLIVFISINWRRLFFCRYLHLFNLVHKSYIVPIGLLLLQSSLLQNTDNNYNKSKQAQCGQKLREALLKILKHHSNFLLL